MRPLAHLVAGVAVWLSLLPLSLLINDPALPLLPLPVLATAVALGAGLSALRVPRLAVAFAQLVGLVVVLGLLGLSLSGLGPSSAFEWLVSTGVDAIRNGAAPVTNTSGLTWLILVLASVLILTVELLANALEQPAWSIVPLAVTFGTAALLIRPELPWLLSLPVVLAYVLVLLVSTPLARDAAGKLSRRAPFQASRAATGLGMGATAAVLALILALLVPIADPRSWGSDGPDGPIQLADPQVQLDRDLRRPADAKVLTYTSTDGRPLYLRTVALPLLTTDGARLVPMELHRTGLDRAYNFPGDEVEATVTMSAQSEYLPAPFAPRRIRADGAWSYDLDSLSIVATGKDRADQTVGLEYSVVSSVPNATRESILSAEAGAAPDARTKELPEGLDPAVRELTEQVTAEANTAGEAALLIQRYLRSGEFDYSFSAPASSGADVISTFLLSSKKGYCIHFAAGMITMARIYGIPARMAIGFTPGERQEDGSYEVTAHDAHAWPELYLDGLGWVPFEPTPAYDGDPDYTEPAGPQPTKTPTATPSETPSAEPTTLPTQSVEPTPTATSQPNTVGSASGGLPLGWLLPVLLVVALAAAPGVGRILQRRSRLRAGQPTDEAADGAWREVRALFADYRLPWPEGSPGPAAAAAAPSLPPQGAAALTTLAHTVELSRFAPGGADSGQLVAQVTALRVSLDRAASTRNRVLARVLPPSLLPRRRPAAAGPRTE
ncbi:MAG: transglutaminaseTgpA domain-containing protein [Arachnia sp.]